MNHLGLVPLSSPLLVQWGEVLPWKDGPPNPRPGGSEGVNSDPGVQWDLRIRWMYLHSRVFIPVSVVFTFLHDFPGKR